jgi:hypothetical protein|nr:hypothetical protein [Corynebacterium jeikeium]
MKGESMTSHTDVPIILAEANKSFLTNSSFWNTLWVIVTVLIVLMVAASNESIAAKCARAFFAVLCWSIGWFGLLVFGYLFGIFAEQFADDVDDVSDPPAVTDTPHAPQPTTPPQTPPAAY